MGLSMGKRGEGWVAIQAVLLLLLVLAPAGSSAWPYAAVFRAAGWLCFGVGTIVLLWSAKNLGRSLTPLPRPLPHGRLVTDGAYRFVRHPIYFAVSIGALGFALITQSPLRLAVTAALILFFDRKARREESWLLERYPEYAAYRRRVKRLLPWIY